MWAGYCDLLFTAQRSFSFLCDVFHDPLESQMFFHVFASQGPVVFFQDIKRFLM